MKVKFFAIIIIFLTNLAFGAFPGMTPSSLDFESVEQGSQVEQRIWLKDDLDENLTVDLDIRISEPSTRSLFSNSYSDHKEISEQKTEGWWEFDVEPLESTNNFSPEGSEETFQGYVDARLSVPEDAEPGIHYGRLSLNPVVEANEDSAQGGEVGFAFSPNLPYKIQIGGNVRRDIVVQDVRGFRLGDDEAAVELLLRNTGTVTTSFEDFEIDIIESSRNVESTLMIDSGTLEPDEARWYETTWREEDEIEEGNYEVDGEINYFTGSAYASGSFSLPEFDVIEVRPDDSPAVDSEDSSLPIWLVLMVLVVLGVLMWSFEIDPVWIFGIVGVLGISAFVLMSNVSNLLLVGVLIPALLIVYLGV